MWNVLLLVCGELFLRAVQKLVRLTQLLSNYFYELWSIYRKTRAYGSAENIKAVTRSHLTLTSEAQKSAAVVNVSEQLEFQAIERSLPVQQQLESAKDHAPTDGDQLLETQTRKLQGKADRARCGNISFNCCMT